MQCSFCRVAGLCSVVADSALLHSGSKVVYEMCALLRCNNTNSNADHTSVKPSGTGLPVRRVNNFIPHMALRIRDQLRSSHQHGATAHLQRLLQRQPLSSTFLHKILPHTSPLTSLITKTNPKMPLSGSTASQNAPTNMPLSRCATCYYFTSFISGCTRSARIFAAVSFRWI